MVSPKENATLLTTARQASPSAHTQPTTGGEKPAPSRKDMETGLSYRWSLLWVSKWMDLRDTTQILWGFENVLENLQGWLWGDLSVSAASNLSRSATLSRLAAPERILWAHFHLMTSCLLFRLVHIFTSKRHCSSKAWFVHVEVFLTCKDARFHSTTSCAASSSCSPEKRSLPLKVNWKHPRQLLQIYHPIAACRDTHAVVKFHSSQGPFESGTCFRFGD